jgi:hypothetical protein
MQRKNLFCIRLQGIKVGKKGKVTRESDVTITKARGRKSHLATGPDEDDGRDASGR